MSLVRTLERAEVDLLSLKPRVTVAESSSTVLTLLSSGMPVFGVMIPVFKSNVSTGFTPNVTSVEKVDPLLLKEARESYRVVAPTVLNFVSWLQVFVEGRSEGADPSNPYLVEFRVVTEDMSIDMDAVRGFGVVPFPGDRDV